MAATTAACWQAWTNADTLVAWYPDRVEGELFAGREVIFAWDSLGQSIALEVVEASPPHRLRLRGRPPNQLPQEQEVRISDAGDSSEVQIVHTGFRDGPGGEDERAGSEAGWQAVLELFRLYLERYPGRARESCAALGAAAADLPAAYAALAGEIDLGDNPRRGQRCAVELHGDAPCRGEVLVAAPPHQLLVSLPEIDAALSLRTFSTGAVGAQETAPAAIVAAQISSWADDPAALAALRPGVETALDRAIATLGGPAAQA